MKRLILAASFVALAGVVPCAAQFTEAQQAQPAPVAAAQPTSDEPLCAGCPTASQVKRLKEVQQLLAEPASPVPQVAAPIILPNAKPDGPLGALAVAPQPQGGSINIGQAFSDALAPYINAAMSALVYAAMGWIFWLLKNKLNINIDSEHRAAITQAAQRQASSLLADGMVAMKGKTIQVDNAALAQAANAAIASAPQAAEHFGLTPETVAARIIDLIPQTPAGAQIVATAHGADPAPPFPAAAPA